jgi:hypothetical protein
VTGSAANRLLVQPFPAPGQLVALAYRELDRATTGTRSTAWGFGGYVDAAFGHGGDRGRVDLAAGFGAAGPADRPVCGEGLEEPERHPGAAGVVGAQEQHRGFAVVVQPFDLGQGMEPLPCELFGEQCHESGHGGVGRELVIGGVQEPFDRLAAADAGELVGEPVAAARSGCLMSMLRVSQVGVVMRLPWCFRKGRRGGGRGR